MNILIKNVEDAGNLEKERIIFDVIADDDIGKYVAFKTKKEGESEVSAAPSFVHWFQDQVVKKGDIVILYTKVGKYQTTTNDAGNTSHFFYWDLSKPIWKDSDDAIALLNIGEWDFSFPIKPASS